MHASCIDRLGRNYNMVVSIRKVSPINMESVLVKGKNNSMHNLTTFRSYDRKG
jgi:hypothetical protein